MIVREFGVKCSREQRTLAQGGRTIGATSSFAGQAGKDFDALTNLLHDGGSNENAVKRLSPCLVAVGIGEPSDIQIGFEAVHLSSVGVPSDRDV